LSQGGRRVQNYVNCLVRKALGKRLLRREHNTKTILKETERKELMWLLIRNSRVRFPMVSEFFIDIILPNTL